jgi:hypothetical protein
MGPRRVTSILLLAALVAAGLLPQPARASRTQESLFQDDASIVYASAARRDRTLDELRGLGVDVLRVNVIWNRYAPHPRSKRKPRFDARDPSRYPRLGAIDAVVNGATARGISVLLTVTAPGPAWASRCKGSPSRRRICSPKPSEYGAFMTALGRRYPGVTRWSIWNEPNLGSWLTPQWSRRGGHWVRWSPVMYRGLVRAATAALAATGHGGDQVLLGETAPGGRTSGSYFKRNIAPADFYRELFCLDARGRKLRGRAARVRGCGRYAPLAVTGIAHHRYTRGAGLSPHNRGARGDITIASLGRLSHWADAGARRGRVPHGLPIWLTEFGFQTRPPDPFSGTSLGNQARWINESDWMMWHNARVRSVAQYEMRDERVIGAFQTGLRFFRGRAKPGLAAYRLPIWVSRGRSSTRLWLHVRPQARIGAPQEVTIQYRARRARRWSTLGKATTDANGYVFTSIRRRAAFWRFRWSGHYSRTAAG